MIGAILAALCGSVAFSFLSARHGLLGVIVTGFLQDLARKVVPGEPVWLEGMVWAALVLALLRYALERGSPLRLIRSFFKRDVRRPAAMFFALVIVQAVVALIRTSSGVVPLIGTLAYAGPALAVSAAAAFLRTKRQFELLFGCYIGLALVNAVGIILSFRGVESPLLDTVGGVFLIYQDVGPPLRLIPGLLRSAEVSSWHCAAAAVLCATFARSIGAQRRTLKTALWAAVVPLLGALVLTGRRKMVVAVALAAVVQILIETTRRRGGWRVAVGAGAAVLMVLASTSVGFTSDAPAGMEGYLERSRTIRTDWVGRAQMTIDSLSWTAWQSGLFGQGTGMTSQGSQHYVEMDEQVLGASETGPSKVMTELGVAGLILLVWIAARLFKQLRMEIDVRAGQAGAGAIWETGLFAWLVANVAPFLIAHQVFGDPFVLLMVGLILGALLVKLYRPFERVVAEPNARGMARLPQGRPA